MKKKTVILMSLLLIMALLGGCGKKNVEVEEASTEQTQVEEENSSEESVVNLESPNSQEEYAAVVYITINPELALYLDGDNKVIAAECLNDDAAEVFSDIQLKELSVETAMETVIETAVAKGYLVEGKTVQIDLEQTDNDTAVAEALAEKVQTAITGWLETKQVDAAVTLSVAGEHYMPESENESIQDVTASESTLT